MKGIFKLRQNDGDPNPETRAQLGAALDFAFKFAEYFLIAGVFGFLAVVTKNWAVIVIAAILFLLVSVSLMTLITGLDFLRWRETKSKPKKALLFCIDAAIYLAVFFTVVTAFKAVFKAMLEGTGI